MTEKLNQPKLDEVKLPLIQTGSIGIGVCVLSAIIGGFISSEQAGSMNDGLWTLVATIPGILIPMGLLMIMPPKPAHAWSAPMLAGTMIRALVVLTIGLGIYMIVGPSKFVFFFTMLATLMITLIIDVSSVLSLIQKHSSSNEARIEAEGIS